MPLVESIRAAERELIIISSYFVPLESGVEGLAALERRGVEVVVVTNSLAWLRGRQRGHLRQGTGNDLGPEGHGLVRTHHPQEPAVSQGHIKASQGWTGAR